MNESPDNEIYEKPLPPGSENWPLWKIEAFKKGEQIPESEGIDVLSSSTEEKLQGPDLYDVPGEKIEYPRIEEQPVLELKTTQESEPALEPEPIIIVSKESVPVSESIPVLIPEEDTVKPEILSSSIKKRAVRWHTEQDGIIKQSIFGALVEMGSVGERGVSSRRGELITKLGVSIKKETGAEILARLGGENIPEKKPVQNFDFNQNKIPSRKGFETVFVSNQKEVIEKKEPEIADVQESDPIPKEIAPEEQPASEKLFDNLSVLQHEILAGDTLWEVLKNTFWESELFKVLTVAQKKYVLNNIAGIVFKKPETFGLDNDGSLIIGNTINLIQLNTHTEEIKKIIEKAKKIITIGSANERETLKLDQSDKKGYIKESVSEPILKPERELQSEPKPDKNIEPPPSVDPNDANAEQLHQEINEAKERLANLENNKETTLAGGVGMAGVAAASFLDKYRKERDDYQTRRAIAEAQGKQKLAEFEKDEAKNPNVERSLKSDMNKFIREKADVSNPKFEKALAEDVNKFFTEGRILKTPGIKSNKWKFIRGLSFSKLVKYYSKDSNNSGLNSEVMEELKKSDKYQKFVEYVSWLKDQTDGAVILFEENTSIEGALRKIGEYLLKNPKKKAA